MIRNVRVVVVILLSLPLISCKTELQPPSAPSNFTVTPSDSGAVLAWDENPDLIYSVYYQVGDDVSLDNYLNMYTRIHSPFTLSSLANQTQYAFILNASNHGSVPGPSTPIVTVTPTASGEGNSWTVGSALTTRALRSVAYSGTEYVAVGDATTVFVASKSNTSSGVGSWNAPVGTLPVSAGLNLVAVLFNGISFVILGADGSIMTSSDTVNWALQSGAGSGAQWTSLAYNGEGTYVAVGYSGAIATNSSTDFSAAWISRTSGTTQDLYGVSFVGGRFVAVGKAGILLTSPDGVTWTQQDSGTVNSLYQVAHNNTDTFVGVGDTGTIITSPDGINWALQTPLVTDNLNGVAYGVKSEFVVVGDNGTILYSTLGAEGTWSATHAGSASLLSVIPGSVFVAVGAAGANVSGR